MKPFNSLIFFLAFAITTAAQPAGDNPAMNETRFVPFEKTIYYKLGDNTVPLQLIQYGNVSSFFCINIHDNEQTSVQAAKSVLETRGGTLLRIQNNFQRIVRFRLKGVVYAFDPNRVFSRTGIEQSLKENGKVSKDAISEVEKFGQRILQLIPDSVSCIIALHNNTEEAYSIKSYLPGGDRRKDALEVMTAEDKDVDDIALTTDEELFRKMGAAGYNSILQDNLHVKKDGSLSVYCGEKKRRYINIETQHGKVSLYEEMLGKLFDVLAAENKKSSSHNEEDSQ